MRILLIEDDAMIGTAVREGLTQAGFAVDWVTDGRAADLSLANGVYDLAVLDLGLPKKDGMAILATLRGMGNSMPILIASARDTVKDRIAGLEAGADDYVLKPFDLDELVARVRALLRRHAGSGTPLMSFGALGVVVATEPTEYLVGQIGWRSVFVVFAGLIVFAAMLIFAIAPRADTQTAPAPLRRQFADMIAT